MYISITYTIEIVWVIKGIDNYGFGKDKKLYNLKRYSVIKQTINGGSKGYWLKGKFFSLKKLKPLLIRPEDFDLPF